MFVIIADSRMPTPAKYTLEKIGNVIWFESKEITYDAISGHPDIFLTQIHDNIIVAPNTPEYILNEIDNHNISFLVAKKNIGKQYPETATYNALITNDFLIHNFHLTEQAITINASEKKGIHVNQGYTRCNCISLENKTVITSDQGIQKTLLKNNLNAIYINPLQIILNGFPNGFIGGTCGAFNNNIVFCGSLSYIDEGNYLQQIILNNGFKIIELYDGPLCDVGSIFFL